MKTPRIPTILLISFSLLLACRVTAQTFTTLHSFTPTDPMTGTNTDGVTPYTAGVILSGSALYGTAQGGGNAGNGTVFALNIDGTGFTTLHSFTPLDQTYFTNDDGIFPQGGVIISGSTLYGTAASGGRYGSGTVFKMNTNGTGFVTLHSFTGGSDGASPLAALILSGSTLYGTAQQAGSFGNGTVFALNVDGTAFRILHEFTAGMGSPSNITNTDGATPFAGLVLSGSAVYGTAANGGLWGRGTVFTINTNGTGFATLHHFTPIDPAYNTNLDGGGPQASLMVSGDTLYGTAQAGGTNFGGGTVFALKTDGTGFTTLHSFGAFGDGYFPSAPLLLSGSTLYGTTYGGGDYIHGILFAVNTDGTSYTKLYSFSSLSCGGSGCSNSDGMYPDAGLTLGNNTLYGTAYHGGSANQGTVFSLSFRPQLSITPAGTNVILSWPISSAGFTYTGCVLQETLDLGSPNSWTSVLDTNPPVLANGQFRVTRPMLGPQWSYRLKQQ